MLPRSRRRKVVSPSGDRPALGLRKLVLLALFGFVVLELVSFRSRYHGRSKNVVADSTFNAKFTVVMATYRRPHLLRRSLARLILNPTIDRIIVVWQDTRSEPPPWLTGIASESEADYEGKVHIRRSPANSMNERFRHDPRIRTRAVFMFDDDLGLQQRDIEAAFQIWRHWGGHGIVGFSPRSHTPSLVADGPTAEWDFVVRPDDEYSMVLTNAAFFDRSYLDAYWSDQLAPARDHVDLVFNCDDILFNFLVSNITSRPPLLFQPREPLRTHMSNADGLWQRPKHFEDRSACLTIFSHLFGGMPLRHTSLSASRDVQEHSVTVSDPEPAVDEMRMASKISKEELDAAREEDNLFEDDDAEAEDLFDLEAGEDGFAEGDEGEAEEGHSTEDL